RDRNVTGVQTCALPIFLLAAACAGCTHCQLSRSTVRQAGTITDLHYTQVLGNLAAFHCNPDVLPHFAVVGTGGTAVTDQASVNRSEERRVGKECGARWS